LTPHIAAVRLTRMAVWVYALPDTCCGKCGVPISAGLPVALVTPAKLVRCSGCADQLGLA